MRTIRISLVAFGAALAIASTSMFQQSAQAVSAGFTCGPYFSTYTVRSLDGTPGRGVRCVKFGAPQGGPSHIIWYGEGYWYVGNGNQAVRYRHVGDGIMNGKATAGDIFGNGEDTTGFFFGNLQLRSSGGGVPRVIQVKGAWNDGVPADYAGQLVQRYLAHANIDSGTSVTPFTFSRPSSFLICFLLSKSLRGRLGS